ncbi:DUF4926 domain-containing protein [Saccharophagus degradans]|uniref:DUF4926 domain-containing protein n=1 Tax=Saccharophagus degradans TaxID=86304 RepID=UPI001C09E6BD|nr:DUF4926 domain-containing protein [Saccharophagus degradans]MBU2983981.1 DUF4926 domain-containing protein [Saccharophagus degradans]
MPYTKCSQCGEEFHLRITSDDSLKDLKGKEESGRVHCIGCFKSIKEYDVVKVIKLNKNVPEAKVGDIGAVVMVYGNQEFEVECVLKNGYTKWLGTFTKSQLKWVQPPPELNT